MSDSARLDEISIRCPMLGHQVFFSYCRTCSQGSPCRKIADCWSGKIDIQGFLESECTEEDRARMSSPPKPKLLQIVELARAARERNAR